MKKTNPHPLKFFNLILFSFEVLNLIVYHLKGLRAERPGAAVRFGLPCLSNSITTISGLRAERLGAAGRFGLRSSHFRLPASVFRPSYPTIPKTQPPPISPTGPIFPWLPTPKRNLKCSGANAVPSPFGTFLPYQHSFLPDRFLPPAI